MAKLLRAEGRTICCRDTVRKDEENAFVDILKHLDLLRGTGGGYLSQGHPRRKRSSTQK
jgi:hypothetical protein